MREWELYFRNKGPEIEALIDRADCEIELPIDYIEVLSDNEALAEALISRPDEQFEIIQAVIHEVYYPIDQQKKPVNVRVFNLPSGYNRSIKDISIQDVGHLRYSNIQVSQRKPIEATVLKAVYECQACGFQQEIDQDPFECLEPFQCPKEEGGCGKKRTSGGFRLLTDQSLWYDHQWIYVMDLFSVARFSRPERLPSLLSGPGMTNQLEVGEQARIVYVVDVRQVQRAGGQKENAYNFFLRIVSVEKVDTQDEIITEEDKAFFHRIAPEIIRHGVQSIAPQIFGFECIKLSLFLQFIGAPRTNRNCGTTERGTVHILLFGDGGTGKSQLAWDMTLIWPRSYFSGAKNVTSAGLTASVVKDELAKGWVLEAGVLVLADKGLAVLDELDKCTDQERGALHLVMEQERVTVNKAGINAVIPTSPVILAVANPSGRKVNTTFSIAEQSELENTLLQRFGIKWIIPQEFQKSIARARADHSIKSKDPTTTTGKRALSVAQMRKYKAYADTIEPEISPDVQEEITEAYIGIMSEACHRSDASDFTQRVLEDIERLVRASARAHLRAQAEARDVQIASWIIRRSMDPVFNGSNDGIDEIFKPSLAVTVSEIIEVIRGRDTGRGVPVSEIEELARVQGWNGWNEQIEIMRTKGVIYYPRADRIALRA